MQLKLTRTLFFVAVFFIVKGLLILPNRKSVTGGGGGDSHIKLTGAIVGNFEKNS